MGLIDFFSRPKREVIAPCDRQHPRQILGKRFLAGAEDIQRLLGVKYTEAERIALAKTLPSEKTLLEYKDKAYLFPGYPISIQDLEKLPEFQKIFDKKLLKYLDQNIVEDKVSLAWYFVHTSITNDSLSENYSEQKELLSPRERIPRVCELIYFLSIFKLMTNSFPIDFDSSASWLRSSELGLHKKKGDKQKRSYRLVVGNHGGKIAKSIEDDEKCHSNVGIVSLIH